MNSPIIAALDDMDCNQALLLARKIGQKVFALKVNDLFFEVGTQIIDELAGYGWVFIDGKFHDIPNTVINTAKKLSKASGQGALSVVTVHASGGKTMMEAAVRELGSRVAAVTVLTSLSDGECRFIYGDSATKTVFAFAQMAAAAGCTYIVCSGHELAMLKGLPLKKIVPGIRPEWYPTKGDQKRVMTPREAMDAGADYLVMGSAIRKSPDPLEAVEKTLAEIEKG